jgi:hypothetical protein
MRLENRAQDRGRGLRNELSVAVWKRKYQLPLRRCGTGGVASPDFFYVRRDLPPPDSAVEASFPAFAATGGSVTSSKRTMYW